MVVSVCGKCRIAFSQGESILWCPYQECPKTDKHYPTPDEAARLRVGEPFDPHGSDRKVS